MRGQHTINLNGRTYDVVTGLPLDKSTSASSLKPPKTVISDITPNKNQPKHHAPKKPIASRASTPARKLHSKTQRSRALVRSSLHKPSAPIKKSASFARSSKITKFAKDPPADHAANYKIPDKPTEKGYASHPAKLSKQKTAPTHMSSSAIKEQLIKKRLADLPAREPSKIVPPAREVASPQSRSRRIVSIGATCLALLLLGGYLTYLNMPNLSIRVAAIQAGIDATLPNYQPENYQLHGPVAYSGGTVKLAYRANNDANKKYTVTQQASTWNSQAALDNYVTDDSKGDYRINSIQGLTVYTYNNKAVWVNGGILYIIDGSAPLSAQQLDRIASSM